MKVKHLIDLNKYDIVYYWNKGFIYKVFINDDITELMADNSDKIDLNILGPQYGGVIASIYKSKVNSNIVPFLDGYLIVPHKINKIPGFKFEWVYPRSGQAKITVPEWNDQISDRELRYIDMKVGMIIGKNSIKLIKKYAEQEFNFQFIRSKHYDNGYFSANKKSL